MAERAECDACHYETTVKEYPVGPWKPGVMKRLCALCSGTHMGTTVGNPGAYPSDVVTVMRTICYVGNVLLDAISEKR
jgi:hypothetical protein